MPNKIKFALPNLDIESRYENNDVIIAGVDESGRGSLAGPIVASAVIIDKNDLISGINDSKKLTRKLRQILYNEITRKYRYEYHVVSSDEIDETNISQANKKACIAAVDKLKIQPDIVLVDGNMKFEDKRFISIIKGDTLSISIAAASIVAKVTRDNIMNQLHQNCPQYLWYKNFGYATLEHRKALSIHGSSIYHRKSFNWKI
ncbi:MAG: ribonuclease HII [Rickettsiaceae bacterium]